MTSKKNTGLTLVVLSLLMCTFEAMGQQGDSLATRVLDEIVFEGTSDQGDTLQNFYRSNASATTETILSRMKSVSLIRRGAFGQEPVLRSLSGGQLNVTIDGMKVFGACTDKMDPVTIYVEPQNLSSVRVLSGTAGSAFGSTVGGSLDMKLADPRTGTPGLKGLAGVDYQSAANAFTYFSSFNLGKPRSAFRLSMTYRKSEDYRAGGGERIPFSQYEKINISVAGKWGLSHSDTLQANALFDQGWNIGFAGLPMDVRKATAGLFSINWRRHTPWLIFHNASAKIYHNNITHSMDDFSRVGVSMHMDMPGSSATSGAFAEGDVHIFHNHRTFVKAEYYMNTVLGEMLMYPAEGSAMYMQTAPRSRRHNAGLFVSQHLRLSDRSKAGISFRTDINRDQVFEGTGYQQWQVFAPGMDRTSTNTANTLTLTFDSRLTGSVRLELQAGTGERIPTLNERYGYYLFNRFDGFDYLGNPELKNERSLNAEATLIYFGDHMELEFTPFYQRIQDYIIGGMTDYSAMTSGAFGVKQYLNLPWATLSGLDILYMVSVSNNLKWVSNLKYTRAADDAGAPLPLIPPLKTVNSIRYEKSKINISVEWEWAEAQRRVSTMALEKPTPAWSVLSLRTGWRINSLLRCNAGVENLFDKNYREHLDIGDIPRPGRNIYLNVTYKF